MNIKMGRTRPTIECLETRDLPSTLALVGSTLFDFNFGPGSHSLTAVNGPTPGTITFTNDGQSLTVPSASVTRAIMLQEGGNHNRLFNGVAGLNAQMESFGDYDVLYSVAKGNTLGAGGRYAVLQDTAGNSALTTLGYGAAVFGGTGDVDTLYGSGSVIYNIVGAATIRLGANHTGDFVNTFFASTVTGLNASDVAATNWFAPGQTPGTFFLRVEGSVLYAVTDNAGDTLVVTATSATLTSPTNGTITIGLVSGQINDVAAFGGNGTDTFSVLDPALNAAMYGQGGPNNVLYLAGGQFGILKTGTTASTSYNGASVFAYSTGAAPNQAPDTLIYGNPAARHVAFSQTNDTLAGFRVGVDQFVGPTAAPTGPVVPFLNDALVVSFLLGLQAA